MVNHDVMCIVARQCIEAVEVGARGIAGAQAQVSQDHVGGGDAHGIVGNANTVARSRLAGDGDVAVTYLEVAFQIYGARHVEYYDARS